VCGIAGILRRDAQRPIDRARLERVTRTLNHRGPDGEGFHVDTHVGLGHQRLSIIDLSAAGAQPMTNEDGSLWVVCNGEIYNYLELRQELMGLGHDLRSHSDTEVILHLYEELGPGCVERLNGMFAFALWDSRQRRLLIARDRMGIKPLYVAHRDGDLFFASEIKALLELDEVQPQLNRSGLADYLHFQFCLGEKTLFAGVERLLPGHRMLWTPEGGARSECYWEPEFQPDVQHTEGYFQDTLLRLLEDTIRLQVRADVPVGAHLSGGLDSSTISCLTAACYGSPIHTFSGGFREGQGRFDETHYARTVAEQIGSIHHEIYPSADDFVRELPRLIRCMDEPAAGPGLFPQFMVSRLARESVKVTLGGQGGDELFAGYTRYLILYLEECLRGAMEGTQPDERYVVNFHTIVPNLRQLKGYEPLLARFFSKDLFGEESRRYFRLIDRSSNLQGILDTNSPWLPSAEDYSPLAAFSELFHARNCKSLINRMLWFDMRTVLPALLHVEDRASMAVGLESRVPLLDHRLVELVATMPPKVKFAGGRSKHIFREVTRHIVPPKIRDRTDKMGFPVPLSQWYSQGPVREFARELLLSGDSRTQPLLASGAAHRLLEVDGEYERGLWGILCLELWLREFFPGDPL
jgi:asparagine synthase (glutamine-hydrolysing)